VSNLPRFYTYEALRAELANKGADVSIDTMQRDERRGRTRFGRRVFFTEAAVLDWVKLCGSECMRASSSTESATASSFAVEATPAASGPDDSARQQSAHSVLETFGPPKSERTNSPPPKPGRPNGRGVN
jgi:hypothetical protein